MLQNRIFFPRLFNWVMFCDLNKIYVYKFDRKKKNPGSGIGWEREACGEC